jgi:hypothetical protein
VNYKALASGVLFEVGFATVEKQRLLAGAKSKASAAALLIEVVGRVVTAGAGAGAAAGRSSHDAGPSIAVMHAGYAALRRMGTHLPRCKNRLIMTKE